MRKSRIFVGAALALAVLGALSACSPVRLVNAITPTSGLAQSAAIPYVAPAAGTSGVHPRQQLDVYQPLAADAARTTHPVIVFFYGGAWQEGDRGDYLFLAEALTSRGYVVVIPDYRVYPEVRYPDFLQDAAAAVAWTRGNIARYGGDPSRIFLMGHSAGAHIAAMLALDPQYLAQQKLPASSIRGWIGLAGPYDFLPLTEPNVIALFATAPDLALTQPIHYVPGRTAGTLPPALLLHGEDDRRVYPKNSINLARALREAGGAVEFDLLPGVNHTSIMAKFTRLLRGDGKLLDRVDRFVRSHAG
jgi:acetyl esterase/lipase